MLASVSTVRVCAILLEVASVKWVLAPSHSRLCDEGESVEEGDCPRHVVCARMGAESNSR